jgi:hypothetical protein
MYQLRTGWMSVAGIEQPELSKPNLFAQTQIIIQVDVSTDNIYTWYTV